MSLPRSFAETYVHATAITEDVAFDPCDAVICLTIGNLVCTLKSGATLTLTALTANAIIPISIKLVDNTSTGTYAALYK